MTNSYFTAISPKWGGSEQAVEEYLKRLPPSPNILSDTIWAQYYVDLFAFDENGSKMITIEIKIFIQRVLKEESYHNSINRLELYTSMSLLATIDSPKVQQEFNSLLKNCYDLKWYQELE